MNFVITTIITTLIGFFLRDLIEFILYYRRITRFEHIYSESISFLRNNLEETSVFLLRLPNRIIIETSYIDNRLAGSLILNVLGRIRLLFRKHSYVRITIPTSMNYYEQVAYIMREVFAQVLALDNVLSYELRQSLINYYAYKFAKTAGKVLDKQVIDILERDFQNSKYRDMIVRLDSKELEEKITLNPPPEVQPLLDRVVIPMLELRDKELAKVTELAKLENERSKIEKILKLLSEGVIGVLFIGKKNPEEYLSYIDEKIHGFHGLLICCRGKYADFYKEYFYKVLKPKIEEYLSEIVEESFEGYITIPGSGEVYHIYHFFFKNLL